MKKEHKDIAQNCLGRSDDEIMVRLAANARMEADGLYAAQKAEYTRLKISYDLAHEEFVQQSERYAERLASYNQTHKLWSATPKEKRPKFRLTPPRVPVEPIMPVEPKLMTDEEALDKKMADVNAGGPPEPEN